MFLWNSCHYLCKVWLTLGYIFMHDFISFSYCVRYILHAFAVQHIYNTNVQISGSAETKVTYLPDGAVVVVFPSNLTIALESGGHPVLENQHRMHFKRKIIAPKNKLVHRLEWRFYLRRKGRAMDSKLKLGQRLRVGELFTRHDSMIGPHDTGGYKEKALLVCEIYHPSLQTAPPSSRQILLLK